MITEERLKELIEQKATIYFAIPDDIEKVELIPENEEFYLKIVDGYLMSITDNEYIYDDTEFIYSLENLFETKEEAEWYLEFGNITRTETLKLPTWEEVCKRKKEIKCWGRKTIAEFDGEEVNIVIPVSQQDKTYIEIYGRFCRLLTKENYIEACRLAKKLFLGEEGFCELEGEWERWEDCLKAFTLILLWVKYQSQNTNNILLWDVKSATLLIKLY